MNTPVYTHYTSMCVGVSVSACVCVHVLRDQFNGITIKARRAFTKTPGSHTTHTHTHTPTIHEMCRHRLLSVVLITLFALCVLTRRRIETTTETMEMAGGGICCRRRPSVSRCGAVYLARRARIFGLCTDVRAAMMWSNSLDNKELCAVHAGSRRFGGGGVSASRFQ